MPAPKRGELLIRIRATTVTAGDCELRGLNLSFGLRLVIRLLMGPTRPRRKILGQELAGDVQEVARGVSRFRQGDPVFATTGLRFGAYAEYICLPERSVGAALSAKPTSMSYEEAATVPTGGLEALCLIRRAGELRGKKVLILGAGGGIGTIAVQLAKYHGAEVTGVDRAEKLDLLRQVGADRVIDYTREDPLGAEGSYDTILDVVGKGSYSACLRALKAGGRYLIGNPTLAARLRGRWTSRTGSKTVITGAARQDSADLDVLRRLIEEGNVRTIIDRIYPLEQIADAHRYFESGASRGRVVITVDPLPGAAPGTRRVG
jgi:NADPH:quinone reductase-like Zn-dependent oxidoreductase